MKPNPFAATLLAIILFSLSNCEIKTQESKGGNLGEYLDYHEEVNNDMVYGIWSLRDCNSCKRKYMQVVNITKDKLEVELLKKQLK